jgi:putative Mg2+ transporter-C (MgtC) family protein
VPELSWLDVLLRVGVAAALGGAIGLERQLRERRAGLRTHMLVSIGAALFTLVSAYGWRDWHFSNSAGLTFDPTRIAAQVVSGIGFLGAGAIIRQGLSVRGLTTAATLWVVAAIGMSAGAGFYSGAVVTTAVVLFALWPLRQLSVRAFPRAERVTLLVTLRDPGGAQGVLDALDRYAKVRSLEFGDDAGHRRVEVDLEIAPGMSRLLVGDLLVREEVLAAEWSE